MRNNDNRYGDHIIAYTLFGMSCGGQVCLRLLPDRLVPHGHKNPALVGPAVASSQ